MWLRILPAVDAVGLIMGLAVPPVEPGRDSCPAPRLVLVAYRLPDRGGGSAETWAQRRFASADIVGFRPSDPDPVRLVQRDVEKGLVRAVRPGTYKVPRARPPGRHCEGSTVVAGRHHLFGAPATAESAQHGTDGFHRRDLGSRIAGEVLDIDQDERPTAADAAQPTCVRVLPSCHEYLDHADRHLIPRRFGFT
jgi:hypothetical protein